MFLQRELERFQKSLKKDFTEEEASAITAQAIRDLKSRNIAGTVIVPLAYLVGGLATDYASEHFLLFGTLGVLLFLAICLRIAVIIAFSKDELSRTRIWLPLFFLANLGCGLVWGCFPASAVLFYHDSLSITLIIILLAGISGGSIASYCIWKSLSYSYMLISLLPAIAAEFYIGNSVTVPIGIAISFYLVFNLIQIKQWNRQYWASLLNTFLLQENSRELAQVNEQLAGEIEDHKKTAQDIAVSRKKLQDLYNAAHDATLIFTLDGQVVDVNATMLTMFETDRAKALQFDINKSFSTTANPRIDLPRIWQAALSGEDQEFEWVAKKQGTGNFFTAQVNLRKTLWGEESVIIATVRDISIQVKALQDARAANRAKSEFLANISHELRTPMHGILGYARLGEKRAVTLPREKLTEYYSLIRESGSRLMTLLNNLLDFSRLEVGKMHYNMSQHNLLPRIHQVVTELTPLASEKKVTLAIACDGEQQLSAYCDQEKICQVVRNLLFNGIKFGRKESTIRIHCDQCGEEAVHCISISNYGEPIPEKELKMIFEKFVQSSATDTGAGGTGLGLAISKQIIDDHGGAIWAENKADGKTVFSFYLPQTAEQYEIQKQKEYS